MACSPRSSRRPCRADRGWAVGGRQPVPVQFGVLRGRAAVANRRAVVPECGAPQLRHHPRHGTVWQPRQLEVHDVPTVTHAPLDPPRPVPAARRPSARRRGLRRDPAPGVRGIGKTMQAQRDWCAGRAPGKRAHLHGRRRDVEPLWLGHATPGRIWRSASDRRSCPESPAHWTRCRSARPDRRLRSD
jgi:hypothetical protein